MNGYVNKPNYRLNIDYRLVLFASLITVFKALDVLITKYGLDNRLMYELNPYYSNSLIHQVPVLIAVVGMVWLWMKKDIRVAKWLMAFFMVAFFYPIINNLVAFIISVYL